MITVPTKRSILTRKIVLIKKTAQIRRIRLYKCYSTKYGIQLHVKEIYWCCERNVKIKTPKERH